jgi:tetratricopeptide (TPR) repeat protein
MKHHVFLSYSRRDTDIMQRVRDILRISGLGVWTDEGIETGTHSWKRAIEKAILDAGSLVCVMSPDANQSQWVRAEIEFAELHEKPIYLILARGDKRSSIPFGFATMQWVDVRQDDLLAERIQDLAKTIDMHLRNVQTEPDSRSAVPVKQTNPTKDLKELKRLGNLAFYSDRFEEAADHYSRAIDASPNDLTLWLNRGISYLEQKNYDAALVDIRHVLKIDATHQNALQYLARIAEEIGYPEEAQELWTEFIKRNPTSRAYFERANHYFDTSDFEKAIADYTIIIDRGDTQAQQDFMYTHNNRAEAHFALGDYEAALADYLQSGEDFAISQAGKAVTLFVLDRVSEARDMWDELMKEDSRLNDANFAGKAFDWPQALTDAAREMIAELYT